MNFSRQALSLPSFKPSRAGLNVTSRWPDTSDFHSPISALVPRPKFMTPSCCVTTGGHFAGACVHPLNDNSMGASNLMAGNRKLA